jgi:hypothetical protein
MRSKILVISAAVLAATACGTNEADQPQSSSDDNRSPSDDTSTGQIIGEPVDAELLLLADSATAAVAPPTLLEGPTSVQAYPGWFSADPDLYGQVSDAFTGLSDYPYADRPLLAFASAPSCDSVDQAELMVDGTRVYAAFKGQPHEECLAPHTQIAIFEVGRAALPKDFTLVGADTADSDSTDGPGELLAFDKLNVTSGFQPPPAQEVTEPGSLDDFVAAIPSAPTDLSHATDDLGADQRAFGFVITGCAATSAELVVTPSQVSAAPVGGETVRCIAPMYYAAVFGTDADTLPDHFKIR